MQIGIDIREWGNGGQKMSTDVYTE